jgi:hypothetical protein
LIVWLNGKWSSSEGKTADFEYPVSMFGPNRYYKNVAFDARLLKVSKAWKDLETAIIQEKN